MCYPDTSDVSHHADHRKNHTLDTTSCLIYAHVSKMSSHWAEGFFAIRF